MKNIFFARLYMVVLLIVPSLSLGQGLQVVTEDYPPYNYQEDNVVKGVGTDVVRAILKEANLEGSFRVHPWARSLKIAETEENTLIYSISRTEKRENLYSWIGVIAPINFYIYCLKSREDIQINNLDDAKKYTIGIVRADAMDEFFVSHGFTKLERANLNEQNMKKLMVGRIDLWPISEYSANYILKSGKYVPGDAVKQVYNIKELAGGDQYLAVSKSTSQVIKDKLQNALISIKQKGIYQQILSSYAN